jgi:hypothetical protein
VGPEARTGEEGSTPVVTNVCGGNERCMMPEMRSHLGEDFRWESVGDGVVMVAHSAKRGDCDEQILFCR